MKYNQHIGTKIKSHLTCAVWYPSGLASYVLVSDCLDHDNITIAKYVLELLYLIKI